MATSSQQRPSSCGFCPSVIVHPPVSWCAVVAGPCHLCRPRRQRGRGCESASCWIEAAASRTTDRLRPRASDGSDVEVEALPVVLQVDDTYMQLKKDLEYLDLKVSPGFVSPLSRRCWTVE